MTRTISVAGYLERIETKPNSREMETHLRVLPYMWRLTWASSAA
jgi:hypothetical protein